MLADAEVNQQAFRSSTKLGTEQVPKSVVGYGCKPGKRGSRWHTGTRERRSLALHTVPAILTFLAIAKEIAGTANLQPRLKNLDFGTRSVEYRVASTRKLREYSERSRRFAPVVEHIPVYTHRATGSEGEC
ncbi:hypothetical protein LXL04_022430 [Taraxacum kok-saghyz]